MADRIPLALLPGLLLDQRLWRAQVQGLAEMADCWIGDFTTQTTIEDMAADVLAAMPGRFALAGLSMGGYVAQEVMRQAPERVAALALLDTTAQPDNQAQKARRRGLIELAQRGTFKGVTQQLMPLLIHPDRLDDTALTGVVMAMAEDIGRDGFLRQQRAILDRPDNRAALTRVDGPALVLCGRQDALTPPDVHEEMAAAIPGAHLHIVEECGHLAPLERPAEVTAALRQWLGRGNG